MKTKQPVSLSTTPHWHTDSAIIVYGCETWSYPFWICVYQLFLIWLFTVCETHTAKVPLYFGCKERHKFKVFENRLLRRIFWSYESGENCVMRYFVICTVARILLGWPNQGEWNGECIDVWEDYKCVQNFGQKISREEVIWEI